MQMQSFQWAYKKKPKINTYCKIRIRIFYDTQVSVMRPLEGKEQQNKCAADTVTVY